MSIDKTFDDFIVRYTYEGGEDLIEYYQTQNDIMEDYRKEIENGVGCGNTTLAELLKDYEFNQVFSIILFRNLFEKYIWYIDDSEINQYNCVNSVNNYDTYPICDGKITFYFKHIKIFDDIVDEAFNLFLSNYQEKCIITVDENEYDNPEFHSITLNFGKFVEDYSSVEGKGKGKGNAIMKFIFGTGIFVGLCGMLYSSFSYEPFLTYVSHYI